MPERRCIPYLAYAASPLWPLFPHPFALFALPVLLCVCWACGVACRCGLPKNLALKAGTEKVHFGRHRTK
jgi:hypothetical protein